MNQWYLHSQPEGESKRINFSLNAFSEDSGRWGLCNNCELHLLGKITTPKPDGLICLGCLQSEYE